MFPAAADDVAKNVPLSGIHAINPVVDVWILEFTCDLVRRRRSTEVARLAGKLVKIRWCQSELSSLFGRSCLIGLIESVEAGNVAITVTAAAMLYLALSPAVNVRRELLPAIT